MKKKTLTLLAAFMFTAFISFTANADPEGGEYSFTTSCGTHIAVFSGTPAQQWQQAVAYAESFTGCHGEIPKIIRLAPPENPPS